MRAASLQSMPLHSPGQRTQDDLTRWREEVIAMCQESARWHEHLCPRQVLGVRLGMAGAMALGVTIPQTAKRLLVFSETDGCFVDGVTAATGCAVGHRTMRIVDYGRVAITAVDTITARAVRVAPRHEARERAIEFAAEAPDRYQAQLTGYQTMPDELFLALEEVTLNVDLEQLLGAPGVRTNCIRCGEEILNRREVVTVGGAVCPGCFSPAYYQTGIAR